MWMDVLKLRDWYRTPAGQAVARTLRPLVQRTWPVTDGRTLLGLGYALPFLGDFPAAYRVLAAMPAEMGVVHWPEAGPNQTFLTWEDNLPLADASVDFVLLAHALEFCPDPTRLLAECFRVLRGEGRVLAVVPNRMGPWCRRELTISPYVRGHPYSAAQLDKLLRRNNFRITQANYALFVPPTQRPWILRHADTFEKIGQRWCAPMGGVVMMEACKDLYAGRAVRVERRPRLVLQPDGALVPTLCTHEEP